MSVALSNKISERLTAAGEVLRQITLEVSALAQRVAALEESVAALQTKFVVQRTRGAVQNAHQQD